MFPVDFERALLLEVGERNGAIGVYAYKSKQNRTFLRTGKLKSSAQDALENFMLKI